jgi:site-specific DNA recombinase
MHAIARARGWMESIIAGKIASFHEIAAAEGLAERHVRRLAPLAYLSPKIIQAIADGTAPASLTVSHLTGALPRSWADQEQLLGLT